MNKTKKVLSYLEFGLLIFIYIISVLGFLLLGGALDLLLKAASDPDQEVIDAINGLKSALGILTVTCLIVVIFGIVGCVVTAKKKSSNVILNTNALAFLAYLIGNMLATIPLLQLVEKILENPEIREQIDGVNTGYDAAGITLIIIAIIAFAISLFIHNKKYPIAKCVFEVVGYISTLIVAFLGGDMKGFSAFLMIAVIGLAAALAIVAALDKEELDETNPAAAYTAPIAPQPVASSTEKTLSNETIAAIKKLKDLYDSGVLTKEEYEEKAHELIDRE
ncbi:MAG: SHOCT domain-containing protein [Bacilli bacterium]|nr:SHOCT domain-containing protein [Bacilli bacterium]